MIQADQTRWPPDEGVTDPVEQRAIWRRYVPAGWHGIYDDLMAKIETVQPGFFIAQAKEKMGGLRVNVRGSLRHGSAVAALTLEAEQQSYRTCAHCGAPGRLCVNARGWLLTVCGQHDSGFDPYAAAKLDD